MGAVEKGWTIFRWERYEIVADRRCVLGAECDGKEAVPINVVDHARPLAATLFASCLLYVPLVHHFIKPQPCRVHVRETRIMFFFTSILFFRLGPKTTLSFFKCSASLFDVGLYCMRASLKDILSTRAQKISWRRILIPEAKALKVFYTLVSKLSTSHFQYDENDESEVIFPDRAV